MTINTNESDRSDLTDVVIYAQAWNGDGPTGDGEDPRALLRGRLFINGTEIPGFINARALFRYADFAQITVRLTPSTFRVVPLRVLADIDSAIEAP